MSDDRLLDAIAASPDSPEPYRVYAEHLVSTGDGLGAFINACLNGADPLSSPEWRPHQLLGPKLVRLVGNGIELRGFHFGFVREATFKAAGGEKLKDVLELAVENRLFRFMREVCIFGGRRVTPAVAVSALRVLQRRSTHLTRISFDQFRFQPDHLKLLLAGDGFPALRELGLPSPNAEVVAAVVDSKLAAQLATLSFPRPLFHGTTTEQALAAFRERLREPLARAPALKIAVDFSREEWAGG
jgi:hypothetical protein